MPVRVDALKKQLESVAPRSVRPLGVAKRVTKLRWRDHGSSLEGFTSDGRRVELHYYDTVVEVNGKKV